MSRKRTLIQLAFLAVSNGYYKGFLTGGIYKGPAKAVCLPGLNCYSCPGALGSCPIGSLQAVLTDRNYSFSFYVAGFLMAFGALLGRLTCGFLCPFGLLQDALCSIPVKFKLRTFRGDRYLRYLKYVILAVFVLILPAFIEDAFGIGDPYFCKYICPSGTMMAAWPLAILNEGIRSAAGWLYAWKSLILVIIAALSLVIYRPFCRYLCPLGAIYGVCNKVALYGFEVDTDQCTGCGECRKACRMDISVFENPNSMECIRCGDCIRACQEGAITIKNYGWKKEERESR